MSYKVKLNIFQGPLDLLLFLIRRDKIDIYDIPVARVTEQYLEYLDAMKLMDLEIAGEFLVMAATLIHIKSKLLLPPDEEELEDAEEADPRDELVKRLLEYKKFKEASNQLSGMLEDHKNVFLRKGSGAKEKVATEDGTEYFEASLFDLIIAFKKVLKEVPKETFHKVVRDKVSVTDKIHEIYHLLAKSSTIGFLGLFESARNRDEAIATFLAVLELIKMREILVTQKDSFGEIEIVRNPEVSKNAEEEAEQVT